MDDYSESSSVRMERDMMMDDSSRRSVSRRRQFFAPLSPSRRSHNTVHMEDEASSHSLDGFESEILRMSRDADKILDSIRNEVNNSNSGSNRSLKVSTNSSENVQRRDNEELTPTGLEGESMDDYDDSMSEELENLDASSRELKQSLDVKRGTGSTSSKLPQITSPLVLTSPMLRKHAVTKESKPEPGESSSEASSLQTSVDTAPSTPQSMSSECPPLVKMFPEKIAKGNEEHLLLATTIVWAVVLCFVVHAKFYFLSETGHLRLPLVSSW